MKAEFFLSVTPKKEAFNRNLPPSGTEYCKNSNPRLRVYGAKSFAAKQLKSETFIDRMHLRYQEERNFDLKLSQLKPNLGGKQEKL